MVQWAALWCLGCYRRACLVPLLQQGCPASATVIGPSPSGPEFLHIQYQGTGDKVVDHTAAKLPQLVHQVFFILSDASYLGWYTRNFHLV